ncbi:MAG: SCO family protein [Chloroflexi bacterium]|nr:SCO family protein [Chloroflexota bacterium]
MMTTPKPIIAVMRFSWHILSLLIVASAILFTACGRDRQRSSQEQVEAASPYAYEGTRLDRPAPDFSLTDQNGGNVTLASSRGKIVVLTFMDTRCDDTCPLTAVHLRDAYQETSGVQGAVMFLGVNVNRDFSSVEDARAFTARYALEEIPDWRFLTGTLDQLQPVWQAYNIDVIHQQGEEDFDHTPGVFLIDKRGRLRWYISVPLDPAAGWDGPPLGDLLARRIQELLRQE